MFRAVLTEVLVIGCPNLKAGVKKEASLHVVPGSNGSEAFIKIHLTSNVRPRIWSTAFGTEPFSIEKLRKFNLPSYLSVENIFRQIAKGCPMRACLIFHDGIWLRGRFYFKMGPVLLRGVIGYDPQFFRPMPETALPLVA